MSEIWLDTRILVIEGSSAAEFLQGYLTCDTMRLDLDHAVPMAICNVKGRVLASGWALGLERGIGLLVHHTLVDQVAKFLAPYLNFSPAKLDPRPMYVALHAAQGIQLLDELYVTPLANLPDPCIDASGRARRTLIDHDFVLVAAPVSEQFLPQMLELDQRGAVDFDKGCYLGQEIVARAQHRGTIKRRLEHIATAGSELAVGDAWRDDGVVVSSTEGHALVVTRAVA